MSNPMRKALGMPQSNQVSSPMGNVMNMMQQFQQFRQSFKGDPQAEIQRLLKEGRITPEQLSQVQSMAQQISQMFRM